MAAAMLFNFVPLLIVGLVLFVIAAFVELVVKFQWYKLHAHFFRNMCCSIYLFTLATLVLQSLDEGSWGSAAIAGALALPAIYLMRKR
ncbi:MAG: hypothetical protein GF416_02970 [Candidatus Altiarchaeales archaeon]|nr:hypothetical protein [Candidatus Altiarchaeales archaeon]MBD3416082.1 hypothetical protein [Candidatus Altiarchaeales archaeon]